MNNKGYNEVYLVFMNVHAKLAGPVMPMLAGPGMAMLAGSRVPAPTGPGIAASEMVGPRDAHTNFISTYC